MCTDCTDVHGAPSCELQRTVTSVSESFDSWPKVSFTTWSRLGRDRDRAAGLPTATSAEATSMSTERSTGCSRRHRDVIPRGIPTGRGANEGKNYSPSTDVEITESP